MQNLRHNYETSFVRKYQICMAQFPKKFAKPVDINLETYFWNKLG